VELFPQRLGIDVVPSSGDGKETPTLLGPLESVQFLVAWNKLQKANDSDCYYHRQETLQLNKRAINSAVHRTTAVTEAGE
jgi:hypothetical protein